MPWPVSRLISSLFQSTLLIRGATHDKSATSSRYQISIHAPHTRSDTTTRQQVAMSCAISIHAPHTRSDGQGSNTDRSTVISIHAPHTRSDLMHGSRRRIWIYFNPRSSYEERPDAGRRQDDLQISIHAPHTRSDFAASGSFSRIKISIHAPHTRSDPEGLLVDRVGQLISIHAPHTRSDESEEELEVYRLNFNPRSSYEERR